MLVLHLVLFIIALTIRVGLTAMFVGLNAVPKGEANPDQLDYENFAYSLSTGEGYVIAPGEPTACRPPGTSFVLAPVYLLFGHSYLAGRLWFCLLSAACVPIVGWIGHRVLGAQGGLIAAAWLTIYPGHAYYAVHFLSETPTTLFTAIALACHFQSLRKTAGWWDAAAGVAWGMGILIRPNLAVAGGLCGLLVLMTGPLGWWHRFQKGAVLAALTTIIVVPWVVRNDVVMGKPGICTIVGGYTFWGSYNATAASDPAFIGYWVATTTLIDREHPLSGSEVEREAAAWSHGMEFIREHPEQLPAIKLHAVLRVIGAYSEAGNRAVDLAFRISWYASLPFVLLGIVHLIRRSPLESAYLLTPLLTVLVTAIIFYGCSRFRDGAAPVLAVFAARGAITAWNYGFARHKMTQPAG